MDITHNDILEMRQDWYTFSVIRIARYDISIIYLKYYKSKKAVVTGRDTASFFAVVLLLLALFPCMEAMIKRV